LLSHNLFRNEKYCDNKDSMNCGSELQVNMERGLEGCRSKHPTREVLPH
jgi:hypothetical protein